MIDDHTFENEPRLVYGDDGATFVRRCEKCCRFVKPDQTVFVNDTERDNATCAKCGRTKMIFEGYI